MAVADAVDCVAAYVLLVVEGDAVTPAQIIALEDVPMDAKAVV